MAKPHPFFLWPGLFLLSILSVAATSPFTPKLATAHNQILKLKVERGRAIVQQELKKAPANAAAILVANYADFITLCVQQDQKQYAKLLEAQEKHLNLLENLADPSPWKAYALAEIRMHLAMSKVMFGNRLAAAWDFRKAYLQYVSNSKKYPDFIPNRKTLGLLQVFIGSVPDNYKWFLNIIGMKGDVPAGMANLKLAATKDNPFKEEALLLYALVQHLLDEEKADASFKLIDGLAKAEPDNLLYTFTAIHLLKKIKQGEKALHYYEKRPSSKHYLPFPYLHHMAADLYLYSGDYENSIKENRYFLEQHTGKHYLKAAHYKLYLAYKLGGHVPQAKWFYNKIGEVGQAEIEEDKYAAHFAEKKEHPHPALLQARLRSDGGYYPEALTALNKLIISDQLPLAVKAEYHYRKARIYHGMEKLPEAVTSYKSTISLCGPASNLYFAPHAALQLGYVYQQKKQTDLARSYFIQAKNYKGHAYKNSIDAKAKLALTTL